MNYSFSIPALALFILLMTLAACGGSDEPTTSGTSGTTATSGATAFPTRTPLGPAPGSVATDREALVAVYNALGGADWEEQENWLTDAPLGEWDGINADDNGRVIWLQIGGSGSGQALSGEIPPELFDRKSSELRGNEELSAGGKGV